MRAKTGMQITKSKQAEEALRESEEKLKEVQTLGSIGSWEFDIESQKILWSDQTYKLYDRNPALGPPTTEEEAAYYSPEQVKTLHKYVHRAVEEGKDFEYDMEAKLPGGKKVYFSAKMHPVKNEYGQVTKLFGTVQDITERRQAEETIRILARFPSENPDPVMRVDRNGQLLYANEASYKSLTWKLQIGKKLPSVLLKIIAEVLKKGIGKIVDTEHNKRIISFNIIPVMEAGYVNLYGRDITEHRHMQDTLLLEKENFRTSLDDSPLGIRIISAEGNTIYANHTILNFYGYESLGELQKTPLKDRYTPESYTEAQKRKHQRVSGDFSATNYEIIIVRKNGEIRHLQVFRKEVLWDGVWHFQIIYEDITKRKQAEEEIKLKNEELIKIVSEKDKFFSIIAHDLRSPFNSFLRLTQIMTKELPGLTKAEIQEIAVSMRNSATNLFRLLENLLQLARIKQGLIPFDPELVQLLPIVDQSINIELESAKNKRIEITYDIPGDLDVFADRNMLQSIIQNLVSNAVKFTHKGGKVSLSAKATDDKSVEISVEDSGIGMSPAIVDNLFRSDVQTSRKGTEGEPSTGLGLLLCKEFIEKHGGKIRVKSDPESESGGKGSVFYFTIPFM